MITNWKILTFIGIFIFATALTMFIEPVKLSSLLEKLIFNAVSVLVGLSIAIIGIFLSSINTIYLSIYKILKTKDQQVFTKKEINKIKDGLSELVEELKENAIFTLFAFIIILTLFFIKDLDLPYIKWFIESSVITKEFVINLLILLGNFLIFWSIIDSTKVVFNITKFFELNDNEE
ncbi:MAG: hypothetical protein KA210_05045 [Bacteroidia bacterium]|nr:hypothetical protein [Bacteroidia bacterium]